MKIRTNRFPILLAALAVGFIPAANAATIVWTVHDITGNVSDVYTVGTFVSAQGGTALTSAISVGGVTFADATIPYTSGGSYLEEPRAVSLPAGFDTDYETLLESSTRNTAGTSTITLTGLTAGLQYAVQLWTADNRGDTGLVLSDGVGNATLGTAGIAELQQRDTTNSNAGQYAIGIFTADANSQSFDAQRYENFNTATPGATAHAIVNAVQLRLIPEPSTALLGGLGMLALLRRRRS